MKKTLTPLMLLGLMLIGSPQAVAQSRLDTPHAKAKPAGLTPNKPVVTQGAAKGGGYCAASASGSIDFDLDERIVNVTFSNINNSSPNAAPVFPAYTLYPTPVGNVTAGMSYTLSVNVNTTTLTTGFSENQVLAWIDYNQDFDFDDAGEQVLVSAIDALDIYSGNVTIPLSATVGTTRMRIRLHDTHDGTDYINVFNDTPCGDASYGEIEDYVLNITSGGGGNAPVNDLCASATVIGVNATCVASTGTTANATQSVAPAACSGFTAASASDVWYTFTATAASTTIEVTGDGDATTGMDPVLEAFSGTCAALTSLGCVDATLRGATETLTIATTPGTTYLYRIYYWPYPGQAVFGFNTCVISAGGGGYCAASASGSVDFDLDERIVNVAFSNINNASANAAPTAPAYTLYNTPVGNVTTGTTYTLSVDVNTTTLTTGFSENQVLAWIDYNQDLDFEDAGEQVLISAIDALDIYTGDVTIPLGATLGTTRMRIRLHDTHDGTAYINVFNDTPCGDASYGEIEDYVLNISSGGGPTPPNDDCTGAVAVNLPTPGSITLSGDNTGATVDPPTTFTVVWEAFTITECSDITVNYCQPGSVFEAFFINLAVQCPDILTGILSGSNDACNVYFLDVPPGTYYIPVRVESDGSTPQGAYTIGVSSTPCGPTGPYCEAGANSVQFEKISNVTFSDINNSSTSPLGYEDFTSVVGSVVGGVMYPISVSAAGGFATDQVLVWIDWNQDLDFDDAGEEVFVSATGTGPFTGDITVPLTATAGQTRMRVRLHDTYVGPDYPNTPNPTPCDTSTYGQVEDYTIDMIGIITGAGALSEAAFGVYPNPTDGNLIVRTGSLGGMVQLEVIDALGRTAYSEQRSVAKASSMQLALAGRLAPGTYLLRLTSGDAREEQRIVVR